MKSRIKETAEISEEAPQRFISNELANVSTTNMANIPRRENLGKTIGHQGNDKHRCQFHEITVQKYTEN